MSDKSALMVIWEIPNEFDLGALSDFADQMRQIPEVAYSYSLSTREMKLIINWDTDYLSHRSPQAPHEFCRGWIVRGIVQRVEEWFPNHRFAWQHIRLRDGRIAKVEDDPVPFELRRIDLHTGQPVN